MRTITILQILFLLVISFCSYGQADTVYYDYQWNLTDYSGAEVMRTLTVNDGKALVEDHFFSKGMDTGYYHKDINIKIRNYSYVSYTVKRKVLEKGDYEDDKETGKWTAYYPNTDQVWYECNYKNGKEDGELVNYYRDGKVKRREIHKAGDTTVTGKYYDEAGIEASFIPFYVKPRFPLDMAEYLGTHLQYPRHARAYEIEGQVLVKFIVNEDGHISDVNVVKAIGGGCDQAVGEMVLHMPPWIPGNMDGRPVKATFSQPVTFKLED